MIIHFLDLILLSKTNRIVINYRFYIHVEVYEKIEDYIYYNIIIIKSPPPQS